MSQTPAKSFAPASSFGTSNVNAIAGAAQAPQAAPTLPYAPGQYPGTQQTTPQPQAQTPAQAQPQPSMAQMPTSPFYGGLPVNRSPIMRLQNF